MKKIIILVILLLVVLAYPPNNYASSTYRSYEVEQIRSDGLVVKDYKGDFFIIRKVSGDIKVGDTIKYDVRRNRLRKSPWQLAKVTEINSRLITLELYSGETLGVNMRNKYREIFKQGEQVYYKKSTGQIKKSSFQKRD